MHIYFSDYLKHSIAASEEANERDGITPEDD